MAAIRNDPPHSLSETLRAALRRWRLERARRHALKDLADKPDLHLLDDAGLTREDADRLMERRWL